MKTKTLNKAPKARKRIKTKTSSKVRVGSKTSTVTKRRPEPSRKLEPKKLERWLHPYQMANDRMTGAQILSIIEEQHMLENCLSIDDLLQVNDKGLKYFRRYFVGELLIGWKSASALNDGTVSVPVLSEEDGRLALRHQNIDDLVVGYDPLICFPE